MKALLRVEMFKCDIIAKLPMELSLQIFSYLEIYFLARSRRVSRKWMGLLSSSPKLSYHYLRPFFGARYPRDVGKGPSMAGDLSRTLEEVDAYRTGRAFTKRFFLRTGKPFGRSLHVPHVKDHTAYCHGIVAWIDEYERGVLHTLRLDARTAIEYVATEREKLTRITISESMVAATTVTGRCYIFELVSGEVHVIRLRSASVSSLVSTGKTIAILHKPAHPDFLVYLTTWSLTNRKTHSFSPDMCSLGQATHRYSYRVLVDRSEASFIYFEQTRDSPPEMPNMRGCGKMTFFATRLALDGQVISRSSYIVDGAHQDRELNTPVPSDNGGSFEIWSDYPYMMTPSDDDFQLIRLKYQLETGSLELQILPQFANVPNILRPEDIFYWKDIGYGFLNGGESTLDSLFVADFDQGVCKEAEMWTLSMTDCEEASMYQIRGSPRIVGDDKFVLVLHADGFIAWCFDKSFTMADESTLYREGRAKEIKRRLEDKESLRARGYVCEECHFDSLFERPPPKEVAFG